jgi:uncharacterized membrane protein
MLLYKIAFTIAVVWFMAGLIGLMLGANRMKPNLLMGATVFLTAALVGYMWDVGHLLY